VPGQPFDEVARRHVLGHFADGSYLDGPRFTVRDPGNRQRSGSQRRDGVTDCARLSLAFPATKLLAGRQHDQLFAGTDSRGGNVIVSLSADGEIMAFNDPGLGSTATVDLILDVSGYFQ